MTTNSAKRHIFWWFITIAWITPPVLIVLTLCTTMTEVFVIYYKSFVWVAYSMFIMTCVLLFTSLARFYIFHIYSNKNVALWLFEKIKSVKYLKMFTTIKSPTLDLLSFFRQTNNYELIFVIVKKFSNNSCEFLPKNKKCFSYDIKNNTNAHKELIHPEFDFNLIFDVKNNEHVKLVRAKLLCLFYYNIMSNSAFLNRDSVKVKHIKNMFKSILREKTLAKLELMAETEKRFREKDFSSQLPEKLE